MDNVEVVERGNIVVNIYEGQKGTTGEPGKSLRFEDLTPEQKAELKGEKGEKGDKGENADVSSVYHLLVNNGYVPASDSLTDVLTYIVENAGNFGDRLEGLECTLGQQPKYGDTVLRVRGVNIKGMVLKERGSDKTYTVYDETQLDNSVKLSHPMDEREVVLDAIWQGEVKSTLVIPGVKKIINVNISADQVEMLTPSDTNREMAYLKKDNELWFQDSSYPTELNPFVIAGLCSELGQVQFDTIVLRLYADPDVRLKDSSSSLAIIYQPNGENIPSMSISSDTTVILDMEKWGLKCDNFIVVGEQGHNVNGKDTLTFIAPKNMLVGTAYTGTTNVPCITANQGDVVQINIKDLTVKILGTKGQQDAL